MGKYELKAKSTILSSPRPKRNRHSCRGMITDDWLSKGEALQRLRGVRDRRYLDFCTHQVMTLSCCHMQNSPRARIDTLKEACEGRGNNYIKK